MSLPEFLRINGIGKAKTARVMTTLELGRRAVSEKNGNNISSRCSEKVANYYIPLLKDLKKEQFRILLLDIKNKIIKETHLSGGIKKSRGAMFISLAKNYARKNNIDLNFG